MHHQQTRPKAKRIIAFLAGTAWLLASACACAPLDYLNKLTGNTDTSSEQVTLPKHIASSCEELANGTGKDSQRQAQPQSSESQSSETAEPSAQSPGMWYSSRLEGKDLQAFLAMQQAIGNRENTAYFPDGVTQQNVTNAHTALRLDCPNLFYLDLNNIRMMVDEQNHTVASMTLEYTATPEEERAMQAQIDAEVEPFLETLAGKSDYDKEIAIHDWLANHITYDLDSEHAGDLYGAVVKGRAKCDGYSNAFTYLMTRAGIDSLQITGKANNGKSDEGHAWNAAKLDGQWYYVDVTWDDMDAHADQKGQVNIPYTYSFFNLPYDLMAQTHTPGKDVEELGTLPKDNATTYDYYLRNGDVVSNDAEAREKLATAIRECSTVPIKFDNREEYKTFRDSLPQTVQEVADELGIGGFNYRNVTDDAGWLVLFSVSNS